MKVLTWNVNKAGESRRELWEMVQREDAEIVLLQEVTRVPGCLLNDYQCHMIRPRFFGGHNAQFSTAVLSKGLIDATPYLASGLDWMDRIYGERYGWIVGCEVTLESVERFQVVSVHSPAFCVPRDQYADVDASGIKLPENPDLWFTEILWPSFALRLSPRIRTGLSAGTSIVLCCSTTRGTEATAESANA